MIEQLDKNELLALLHKRCTECGVVKYFGEFSKKKRDAGGVEGRCRECRRKAHRKWYQENKEQKREYDRKYQKENKEQKREGDRRYYEENKEKRRESGRKYYEENKEKVRESGRKYREENKEKVSKAKRKYYEENKEKVNKVQRKYREENKEKVRENKRRRRARKMDASGSHTADQVKARFDYYGNKCIYCGSSDSLQIEHRIPLSRGGSDWASNLAPACKSCNCSKGTKTEAEFKKLLEETK